MDGVYFVLSIIAIGLVMRWLIMNEAVAADKPTKGLFAMRDTVTGKPSKSKIQPMIITPDSPGPPPRRRQF